MDHHHHHHYPTLEEAFARRFFLRVPSLLQVQARLRKRNRLWLHKVMIVVKSGRLGGGFGNHLEQFVMFWNLKFNQNLVQNR